MTIIWHMGKICFIEMFKIKIFHSLFFIWHSTNTTKRIAFPDALWWQTQHRVCFLMPSDDRLNTAYASDALWWQTQHSLCFRCPLMTDSTQIKLWQIKLCTIIFPCSISILVSAPTSGKLIIFICQFITWDIYVNESRE